MEQKHAHADSGDYRYHGTMTNGNVAAVLDKQPWPGDDVALLRAEVDALRAEVDALRAALFHLIDANIATHDAMTKMAKIIEEWTGE